MNKRKVIPSLRSLADQERATAKKARASWQMFTIMAEFIEATEYLSEIRPAISIYGSARLKPESPYYKLTMEIAQKFSDAGFAVISGGGPGIMEAANKGAHAGKSPSVGLNIELPPEQSGNQWQDISLRFRHFFTRQVTFVKNSDAVVVMPGGFGTLDEIAARAHRAGRRRVLGRLALVVPQHADPDRRDQREGSRPDAGDRRSGPGAGSGAAVLRRPRDSRRTTGRRQVGRRPDVLSLMV